MTNGNPVCQECVDTPNCLSITFIGICTHLWADQPNAPFNPAWGTRIVMPNASDPNTVGAINQMYGFNDPETRPPIMPHVATLAIPVDQFAGKSGPKIFLPWAGNEGEVLFTFLDGVTITVPNSSSTQLVKEARCMPALGAWVANIAPGETAISQDHVQAAGYFDFQNGQLQGMSLTDRGYAGGIVYCTATDGAAQILITPFDPSVPPTAVSLTSGAATAYILNIPVLGDKDNDNDFVLHYLVANDFPPPPWPPASPELNFPCLPHPGGQQIIDLFKINADFGVGCSNSNLP